MSDRRDLDAGVFDPGLQLERTALAWRRTGLAMGVGALAALRIFPALYGPAAFIPAGIAVALAAAVLIAAQLRYRREHSALLATADTQRAALSGGALPALVASATLLFGVVAAAFLLLR